MNILVYSVGSDFEPTGRISGFENMCMWEKGAALGWGGVGCFSKEQSIFSIHRSDLSECNA